MHPIIGVDVSVALEGKAEEVCLVYCNMGTLSSVTGSAVVVQPVRTPVAECASHKVVGYRISTVQSCGATMSEMIKRAAHRAVVLITTSFLAVGKCDHSSFHS